MKMPVIGRHTLQWVPPLLHAADFRTLEGGLLVVDGVPGLAIALVEGSAHLHSIFWADPALITCQRVRYLFRHRSGQWDQTTMPWRSANCTLGSRSY